MSIYLAGACDALEDLGVGWRREAAAALADAGMSVVWPAGLDDLRDGLVTAEEARAHFAEHRRSVIGEDVERLLSADAVLLRLADAGEGTRAEAYVARVARVPVYVWAKQEDALSRRHDWLMGAGAQLIAWTLGGVIAGVRQDAERGRLLAPVRGVRIDQ